MKKPTQEIILPTPAAMLKRSDKTLSKMPALLPAACKYKKTAGGIMVQGNSIDVLEAMQASAIKVDAVITDPPWMTTASFSASQIGGAKPGKLWGENAILGVAMKTFFTYFRTITVPQGSMAVFCGDVSSAVFMQSLYEIWPRIQMCVWNKVGGARGRMVPPFKNKNEFIIFAMSGLGHPSRGMALTGELHPPIFTYEGVPPTKRLHGAEKPVALLEEIVKICAPEGGLVADFFAGSHALAEACVNTGRRYICVEIDADYHKRAVARAVAIHRES